MAVFTVLGAGMMGSALCVPLVDAGHEVRLVGTHLDREIIEHLRQTGSHPKLDCPLPATIQPFFCSELPAALHGADAIGLGVSSQGVRWAAGQLSPYVRPDTPIVMISKGLEYAAGELHVLPDVLRSALPAHVQGGVNPAAVAGPCIAGELARRAPTCVVLTARDPLVLERLARWMRTPYYHVHPSADVVGVEVCAALKNAYAMGIAFAAGLHARSGGSPGSVALHNLESAVFAQSIFELQRIVTHLGGDPSSAWGLPGVGDLDVTCNGGRTGRFGQLLGMGLGVAAARERLQGATLECLDILRTLRSALAAPLGGAHSARSLSFQEVPLLNHLMEVALDEAPVSLPLERFFRR